MTDPRNLPEWAQSYLSKMDEAGYVPFNSDRRLGQNQYASRYANGRHGDPDLGHGLRWQGNPSDYHFLKIHIDDLVIFHERVEQHRNQKQW